MSLRTHIRGSHNLAHLASAAQASLQRIVSLSGCALHTFNPRLCYPVFRLLPTCFCFQVCHQGGQRDLAPLGGKFLRQRQIDRFCGWATVVWWIEKVRDQRQARRASLHSEVGFSTGYQAVEGAFDSLEIPVDGLNFRSFVQEPAVSLTLFICVS